MAPSLPPVAVVNTTMRNKCTRNSPSLRELYRSWRKTMEVQRLLACSFRLAPSGSLLLACSPWPLIQQAHFPRDGATHSGLSPPTAQQLRKCLTDVLTCQPILGNLPAESPSPHVKPDCARPTPGADYVRLEGRGRKIQMLTDSQQVLGSKTDPAAG